MKPDEIGANELLYDSAAFPEVLKRFPNAKMEDASDFIHENRVFISIPDVTPRQFFKAAILDGYFSLCLMLNVAKYEAEDLTWMKEVIDEIKVERTPGSNQ